VRRGQSTLVYPPGRQKVLENFYDEKIEAHYPQIYNLLIDQGVDRLEPLDRLKALAFFFSQFARTSKLGVAFNQGSSRMLEDGHSLIDPLSNDQKIFTEDGNVLFDFAGKLLHDILKEATQENKETVNRKNFENFLELNRRRLKDIIAIYKFGEDHSLITSDNPVESSNL
jgi:hypothetical protein